MMDTTLLNLTTILISGAGLFAVLTKFSVPELRMTFFGENPFAIKRDQIDFVMTWIFTSLAISGLLVQVFKEIFGNEIPEPLHQSKFYLLFFILGIVAMVWTLWVLSSFGRWVAKRSWLPVVVQSQRELFDQAVFIVEHNGWREDQLKTKDSLADPDRYVKANFETAEKHVLQIENLLDLPTAQGAIPQRIDRLRPYFRKDS